jgi:hypothetical protein
MGTYPVDCPKCKKQHMWFSGNQDQRCNSCIEDEKRFVDRKEFAFELLEQERMNLRLKLDAEIDVSESLRRRIDVLEHQLDHAIAITDKLAHALKIESQFLTIRGMLPEPSHISVALLEHQTFKTKVEKDWT